MLLNTNPSALAPMGDGKYEAFRWVLLLPAFGTKKANVVGVLLRSDDDLRDYLAGHNVAASHLSLGEVELSLDDPDQLDKLHVHALAHFAGLELDVVRSVSFDAATNMKA